MKKGKAVVVILMLALLMGVLPPSFGVLKVWAEKSTREQIKEKEKEKNDIKNKLDDKKGDIKDLKGEKRSLQDDLADANDEMIDACNHLADIEEQIRVKNDQIEQNQADLADAIEREENKKMTWRSASGRCMSERTRITCHPCCRQRTWETF